MTASETMTPVVKVGDFFYESWGYDQTNLDFYQVVRVSDTGKTIWMRHVANRTVRGGDGGPADYVMPVPITNHGAGPVLKKRLRTYNYRNEPDISVHMTSYSDAYLWDGEPKYQTGANWGH